MDQIDAEAELTFTHRGSGLISADHTASPDALKGPDWQDVMTVGPGQMPSV